MSEKETRTLAEKLIQEVWSVDGNLDAANEVLAEDYVINGQDQNAPWPPTREGEKQQAAAFRAALDIRSSVQDVLVDGDKAAIHWQTTGTHQGEFMGMPPRANHSRFMVYRSFACGRARSWKIARLPTSLA